MDNEPTVLKLAEVAALLKCHPCTVRRIIKTQGFPVFKIGTELRFNREHITRWMLSQPTANAG